MPQVSVAIPTFGYPEFLTRAPRSVLAQRMSDLEVILVDGSFVRSGALLGSEQTIAAFPQNQAA